MKLSLGRMSMLALALGLVGGVSSSGCADSEGEPFTPPPGDTGDATLPNDDGDAEVPPDASPEAGPKACSDHGFCPTTLPPGQTLEAVWGDGAGAVWTVTREGNLLRWDGNAWKVHASDLGPLHVIWGSGPTDIYIGGEKGLFHGTGASSAGLVFEPVTLPGFPTRIFSVWGLSATDVWAVGTMDDPDTGESVGRVLHLAAGADAGAQWKLDPISGNGLAYTHVWGSAEGGVWIAGSRPLPDFPPEITELAILHKTSNKSFTEIELPLDADEYPPYAKPAVLYGTIASTDKAVTLHGRTVGTWPTIWRGTSTDNGETFTFTWERDGRPGDPELNVVFGTDVNDIWAAGEYGQVRHWNGTTWSAAAITTQKLPVIDPFYGIWARGSSDVWLVGKGIALRHDPTQVKDGGVQ